MVGKCNYLQSVFPEPPLVAFKRQTNIRESITRAEVAPERQPRIQKGVKSVENAWHAAMLERVRKLEARITKTRPLSGK